MSTDTACMLIPSCPHPVLVWVVQPDEDTPPCMRAECDPPFRGDDCGWSVLHDALVTDVLVNSEQMRRYEAEHRAHRPRVADSAGEESQR